MGWVGSTIAKVSKYLKGLCSFNARLDNIWLHREVKFDFTADPTGTGNRSLLVVLGLVGLGPNFSTCSGLGQSADGLGWIGSHKIDPWTTLRCIALQFVAVRDTFGGVNSKCATRP